MHLLWISALSSFITIFLIILSSWQLVCALPCYTFLTPLFHFITLLWRQLYTFVAPLLNPCYTFITPLVTALLHISNTRFTHLLYPLLHLRYIVVTLIITILMHPYSVAFCPVFVLLHFVLWSVAFCPCLIWGILSGIPRTYMYIWWFIKKIYIIYRITQTYICLQNNNCKVCILFQVYNYTTTSFQLLNNMCFIYNLW